MASKKSVAKFSSGVPSEQKQVSFFGLTEDKPKTSYFSSPIVKIRSFMTSIINSVEKKIRK